MASQLAFPYSRSLSKRRERRERRERGERREERILICATATILLHFRSFWVISIFTPLLGQTGIARFSVDRFLMVSPSYVSVAILHDMVTKGARPSPPATSTRQASVSSTANAKRVQGGKCACTVRRSSPIHVSGRNLAHATSSQKR